MYLLGAVWSLFRVVYFLVAPFVGGWWIYVIVYAFPTNIQVALFTLLLLYCAQRVHYDHWYRIKRVLFVSYGVVNGVLLLLFAVYATVSLLFSQELELPDVLRLWDSLFGDAHRFDFLLFFACAVIQSVRSQLLTKDFAPSLMLLQDMPIPDVAALIADAAAAMNATDPRCLESDNLAEAYSDVVKEVQKPPEQPQQQEHHHIFSRLFNASHRHHRSNTKK